MSRVSSRVVLPDPPEGLQLSPVPNIRMASGAAAWITEHLGIAVSERYVRVKTNEKLITYSLIGGVRFYSSNSLYAFIMSTQKVSA